MRNTDEIVNAFVVVEYDTTFGDGAFVEDFGLPPTSRTNFGRETNRLWREFYDTANNAVLTGRRAS